MTDALARERVPALNGVRTVAREHGLPIALILAHGAAAYLGDRLGIAPFWRNPADAWGYTLKILRVSVALFPLLAAVCLIRRQPIRPYLTPSSLAGVVLAAAIFAHAAAAHDLWKGMLGILVPYTWDVRLADLDSAMHGTDPWRVTHFLFGWATRPIDLLYVAWFGFLTLIFAWIAWSRDRVLRTRFLTAWVLTWIVLGTGVAYLMPSGGPVFYEGLTGEARFRELLPHLEQAPTALRLQARVWADYVQGADWNWVAMSAMPSLHVAAPTLATLALRHVSRPLAIVSGAYLFIVVIGSVHLGWHYAVDAYVSVLGAGAVWWISGRVARRSP